MRLAAEILERWNTEAFFSETKTPIFQQGVFEQATNNIGEFLALVHALAFCKKSKDEKLKQILIYSDSITAMAWVRKKKVKISPININEGLFKLIQRAEHWLQTNTYQNPIKKWHTKVWGEIPADFGRK